MICAQCGHPNPETSKFCGECAAPLASGADAARDVRKTITAVFCDLVGSTPLGERLDPEVLRLVMSRYFDEMRKAVERHGGRVEKFIGDAVVAVFGVPQLHEDDALRAVRAAAEMRSRLQDLNVALRSEWGVELQSRIGVCTGEVVVGRGDGALLGDVMNTAARLQTAAGPGEVLLADATWRLVRDAVAADPVDPVVAKGKAEPVVARRLVSIRAAEKRGATPFIGRDRYVSMLTEALQDATDAQAGVLATILAPPGVGKSRLAEAFAQSLGERASVLVGQTPSYGEGVTFAPLVEILSHAAGVPSGDAETVAASLQERMASQSDGASVGARLARFLGVGEALGADTSWAVRRLLEVLAAERPLVVIVEDVHWAEPPMLDLVDSVVERVHGAVLFLCLARPELLELRPSWAAAKPRSITATLPPLTSRDARRIGEALLGETAPTSVVERVCETAEGNPLYLEQLTAMLADQGLVVDGEWCGSDDVEVEIPGSLQALLAARLDRLDSTPRLVLELASIEGRRFRSAALGVLAPDLDENQVEQAMISLDRSGLVHPEDEAGGLWQFSHALILEAAYRGLSKRRRADLHQQLADWLSREDADRPDADESVARHLERALRLREELGMRDEASAALSRRAGELFATAGLRAFAALDFITTRDLLNRAALLLPASDPQRLEILPNLGVALTETGRPKETETLLADALARSLEAGLEREALRAKVQLLSNCVYRSPSDSEVSAAVTESEAAFNAFQSADDHAGCAEAAVALDYLEFMRGRAYQAHEWCHRALEHGLCAGRFRESAQAAADLVFMVTLGPVPFDRFPQIANERVFPLDDPIAACAGHCLLAVAALAAGDQPEFAAHERRWRETVDLHGLGWLGAAQALLVADVETASGHPRAAERRLREARNVLVSLGDVWWVSTLDSTLCKAIGAQGDTQRFLRLADEFDLSPPVTDREILIRRSLVRAQAFLLRGAPADAEAAARAGIELAVPTDLVTDHADALLTLAATLDARGLAADASKRRAEAETMLRAKGHVAAIAALAQIPA